MRMADNQKITVIVPVYNLEKEISDCINSIQCQTYQNLEIVIIDDGSTDHSKEEIQRLAEGDKRIVPIFKGNGGVTSARLAGIAVATGDWIGFVDGDDYVESEMYERLFNNALCYGAQVSHCGYQMCFPDGRVRFFHNSGCVEVQDKIAALKELLSGERIEPGLCNKLFHKSLFRSLMDGNVMDASIRINEDLLMNYYLFKEADKSVFEDWCPYHYMVRYTSVSRQELNEHKIYDPIKVKQIIANDASEKLEESAKCAYLGTCLNTYNSLIVADDKKFDGDTAKVRQMILDCWESRRVVSVKTRVMLYLIRNMPLLYRTIYLVYARLFQKSSYT